jgi:tight adherence protein B
MDISLLIFVAAVFAVATLLAFGAGSAIRPESVSRLRARLETLSQQQGPSEISMIREQYLRDLSPVERALEDLPGMDRLETLIKQAGRRVPAYRLVLLSLTGGLLAGTLTAMLTRSPWLTVAVGSMVLCVPLLRILQERRRRLMKFEDQLVEALDIMSRALRAGNPFNDALRTVTEEMTDPAGTEFELTWSHLNYGLSMKASLDDLMERVPSLGLRVLATAVLVQRETGGNLAEILDKLSEVLRARYRFLRRVRTLSAEGRMSAWILVLMPFVMAAVISITSPSYLPMLTKDPIGQTLILVAAVTMTLGIVWIRRIIRVRI